MKILVIHNRYQQRGGEDRVVDAEIALLLRHGHDVRTLIEDNRDSAALSSLQQATELIWSRQAGAEVRALCQQWRPDVAHVHNTFARLSPAVLWAAHGAGVPVVQTLHNQRLQCLNAMLLREGRPCTDCVGRLPWRGVIYRCYRGSALHSAALASHIVVHRALGSHLRCVARFIALSQHARAQLIEGGLPAERIVVKPNFAADPGESAISQSARTGLLFVGRLSEEKGLAWLMQASAKAQCRVTVIGSGPMAAACQAHPWFDCQGEQAPEQVQQAMLKARALLMPSLSYEAMPRVLVEAFACGLPVLASRLGALAELITHGGDGWGVVPGDVAALAAAMIDAQAAADLHPSSPSRWAGMAHQARQTYLSNYTPEIAHRQLLQVYDQAIAATVSAPRTPTR